MAPTLHRLRGWQAAPIRQAWSSPQGLHHVRSYPPRGRFLSWGGPAIKRQETKNDICKTDVVFIIQGFYPEQACIRPAAKD
jgi:hypothetical protein